MCFFKRKKKNKVEVKTEEKEAPVQETSNVEEEKTSVTAQKEKKAGTKTEATPAKAVSKKGIYRVLYDKENRLWLIKKDGAKRTIASFVTKEAALNRVKELSTKTDTGFVVHKKDGKFQKK